MTRSTVGGALDWRLMAGIRAQGSADVDDLHERIHHLAECGTQPSAIALVLGLPVGEVLRVLKPEPQEPLGPYA